MAERFPVQEPLLALHDMGHDSFQTMSIVLGAKGHRQVLSRALWGLEAHIPSDSPHFNLDANHRNWLNPATYATHSPVGHKVLQSQALATLVTAIQGRCSYKSMNEDFCWNENPPVVYACVRSGIAEYIPTIPHHIWLVEGEYIHLRFDLSHERFTYDVVR